MGISVEIWSRSFLVRGALHPTLPKTVSPALALANPSRSRLSTSAVEVAPTRSIPRITLFAVVEMIVVIRHAGDDRGAPKIYQTSILACERLDFSISPHGDI